MRAVRLTLYFFAFTMVLTLGGCDLSPISQTTLPRASPSTPSQDAKATPFLTSKGNRKAIPARLLIPVIHVNASIEAVGITPDGELAVPTQNPWEDVGWYASGPYPGERGSAVIDGHLDRPGGYPAVFWRLRDLHIGDKVMVIDANGKTLHFHVIDIALYSPQDAPIQEIFGNETGTYLNLITCAGDWIASQHQTTLRLVIYTSPD